MKKDKIKLIILIILLITIIVSYLSFLAYTYNKVKKYTEKVLPMTTVGKVDIGDISYKKLEEKINSINDMVKKEQIVLVANGKDYTYTYDDLGITLKKEELVKEIKKYQKSLKYTEKVDIIYYHIEKNFSETFAIEEEKLVNFLNTFKQSVDANLMNGYFNLDNDVVTYVKGVDAYNLDIEKSKEKIKSAIKSDRVDNRIELVGTTEKADYNESYVGIDTKVSSFYTEFNQYLYARVQNLRTALGYINGAIVEPGEIFSFYNYAGPFNKSGYVFYYEFVGNGVCQIATTTYNAALLGGLEIVKRYPHAAKSPYVAGGLDATVASYSSGWYVDMAFKNTYKYPIYIKAYMVGNKAYVEFWSNKDAKEGKTYQTESVQIGARGYTSYLYTYDAEGNKIDKQKIATTWYTKD